MLEKEQIELIEKLTGNKLTKLAQQQLNDFIQIFKIYNSHTNLVSKNDEKNLFEKHIYDSLNLCLFLEKYKIKQNAKILDIGTGGGFPSIPISILYPDIQVYPLDSVAKKIGFVELVQKELRLDNLHPICKRVEEISDDYREYFDVVTSRAVASLNILLEYSIPYAKVNGYFVAFKSKGADEELVCAQNALSVLKCKTADRIQYNLPSLEMYTRELVVIEKQESTSRIYPRKSGQAKKNPL